MDKAYYNRQQILAHISDERGRQDEKWGDEFDKKNTSNDWITFICAYAGKAYRHKWDPINFRLRLIQTAAICVAAIEILDESVNGSLPPTHYDGKGYSDK